MNIYGASNICMNIYEASKICMNAYAIFKSDKKPKTKYVFVELFSWMFREIRWRTTCLDVTRYIDVLKY